MLSPLFLSVLLAAAQPTPSILLPPQPVGEPIDCNGPVFKAQIFNDDVQCREVSRTKLAIDGQNITLRLLHDDDGDADLPQGYAAAAYEAVEKAFEIAGKDRDLKFHNVSILPVESYGQRREARMSGVTYWRGKAECIIELEVVTASHIAPEENLQMFKFIMAHEAFHCVQSWNWSHQMALESSAWWKEGTADLIGMLSFPGYTAQSKINDGFAEIADAKSVLQMDYGNIVFFYWLWSQSPQKVFDLIAAMPKDKAYDSMTSQEAALHAFLPGDAAGKYAAAYRGAAIFASTK
jgi:hypothetical protein